MHAHARAHIHTFMCVGGRRPACKAFFFQSLTDLFTDLVLVSFFLGTSRGGGGFETLGYLAKSWT